jgi:hypothetical protein
MVINKNQSLFVSDKFDATESIIEVLKNKQLYKEYNESELLSESK